MKQTEAARLVGIIRMAWPQGDFPPESVTVYARAIGDLEYGATTDAVQELVKTRRRIPSIADIRERVAEHACALPSTEDAWLEVEAAIRKFDGNDRETWTYDDEFSSPVIGRAARSLGGVSVMHEAPILGFVRRDFIDAYGKFRRQSIDQSVVGLGRPVPVRQITAVTP